MKSLKRTAIPGADRIIREVVATSGLTPEEIEALSLEKSVKGNSIKARSVYNWMAGVEYPSFKNVLALEKVTGREIVPAFRQNFEWCKIRSE